MGTSSRGCSRLDGHKDMNAELSCKNVLAEPRLPYRGNSDARLDRPLELDFRHA